MNRKKRMTYYRKHLLELFESDHNDIFTCDVLPNRNIRLIDTMTKNEYIFIFDKSVDMNKAIEENDRTIALVNKIVQRDEIFSELSKDWSCIP